MTATKWAEMTMLGFDLETGGINTSEDRIVQAAVIEVTPGQRPKITTWLINSGIDIPEAATEVHGITTEHAREHGQDPATVLFELTGRLALWLGHGRPVVGYNVSFDLTMLEAENRRHGVDTLTDRLGVGKLQPIIDVHVLDKYADPYRRGGRKLVDVCTHYGVTNVGAHDASGDALAACRLWPRVMAKHATKFRGHTLGSLHQSQVGWRKDQMDGLRAYFDKNGIEHDGCDSGWPLQSIPAGAGVSR
jgi:DNA polymerase-3 subunit epsilon